MLLNSYQILRSRGVCMFGRELAEVLPILPACTHVKGHGGLKSTVRRAYDQLPNHRFVLRTDVKEYYASIDHFLLMEQLAGYINDKFILNLLWQYLNRLVVQGGVYREIQRSISRGCPLSPVIGAFFLTELDARIQENGLFYVRYIDDILILAPTRWKFRRAVKRFNEELARMKLERHPDKTFIGRIEKGFDFLGYHFCPKGLRLAEITFLFIVTSLCCSDCESFSIKNNTPPEANWKLRLSAGCVITWRARTGSHRGA